MKVAIIGAGAAGVFCAIRIKEELRENGHHLNDIDVTLYEKGAIPLRKVKVSGGGRCNVTHALFTPKEFAANYPRGNKELVGPFHQFLSGDMLQWLDDKGVKTKIEDDGRIFPESNESQTIIDCFSKCLNNYGVHINLKNSVVDVVKNENDTYQLKMNSGDIKEYDALMIATGSDKSGHFLAQGLGHSLTPFAPSLFTFKTKDPVLKGLEGTSLQSVSVDIKIENKSFTSNGPILVTHWGLSGPAILKLSAWAALELKNLNYHFDYSINLTNKGQEETIQILNTLKREQLKKKVINTAISPLTKRMWERIIEHKCENSMHKKWADISTKDIEEIASALTNFVLRSNGSHRYKEEFVECGGICCKEINFKTYESRINNNLYFAGEILNIDGITGGFNFQNAWTGAYLAAKNICQNLNIKT